MPHQSRARITLASVQNLEPQETLWDMAVHGLCVRRRNGPARTYAVKMRIAGRQRWITIGRHGAPWTPETARREALRILGLATKGEDVGEQRRAERDEPTLAEVAERFLVVHGPKLKPRTRDEYARSLTVDILPKLGRHKISALTRADCSRFHSSLAETPRKANLLLAILSRILTWAAEHGYRDEAVPNPCKGIRKFRENARERFLSTSEYQQLGAVLDRLASTGAESLFAIAAIRLLMLTGARLSEILTLRWAYVDLERAQLKLPDTKTGPRSIRLSEPALDVLKSVPRVHGNPFVIVGRRDGARLINLQKPWQRIRELAGISDVHIHDLRHSFASVAVASGASLPIVGKLLGHTQPGTTARYAHLSDDPLRRVNEQVGDAIAAAVSAQSDPPK